MALLRSLSFLDQKRLHRSSKTKNKTKKNPISPRQENGKSPPIFLWDRIHEDGLLPLWIPWQYKWIAGPTLLALGLSAYLATNHGIEKTPHPVFLGKLDQRIPFIPESVWIYDSELLLVLTAFALNRCLVSLHIHLYSFATLVICSCFIFWVYPTTYPREEFLSQISPDPQNPWSLFTLGSLWTKKMVNGLWQLDRPMNCLPSLHVSLAFQIALGFREDQKPYFPLMILWCVLICFSTLTLKQHSLFDVLAGLLLDSLLHEIFSHRLTYRLIVRKEAKPQASAPRLNGPLWKPDFDTTQKPSNPAQSP
ncbi:MAG: phosphatase PAP2 family protein [Bdellovibrionia bacterium]